MKINNTLDLFELYGLYKEMIEWENSNVFNFHKIAGIETRIKTWFKRHQCNEKEQHYFKNNFYTLKLSPSKVWEDLKKEK